MQLNEYLKTILITGCVGDIAISLARLLRNEGYTGEIIGADTLQYDMGKIFYDHYYLLPKADQLEYLSSLQRIIEEKKVELVIPGSEAELSVISKSSLKKKLDNVKWLCVDPHIIDLCLDKYKTVQFLKENGLAFPQTSIVGKEKSLPLPCVIKRRFGQGSKGFMIVENEALKNYCENARKGDIWQELLLPDDQEYTCGVFNTLTTGPRFIVIRRTLKSGLTGHGEVVSISEIDCYLETIVKKLQLNGAINVQLRLTKRGPVAFEINPRLSSTVLFRHLLGFKDFIWSLQSLFNKKIDDYTLNNVGSKLYRGVKEYIYE